MQVTQYTNNSAIAADPERAQGAMFKLNNAVYRLVRVSRDETALDRGEYRIGSITINKFREADGQWGSQTTTSTDRYINALSSMAFPFDPYALYNALPLSNGDPQSDYGAGIAGLMRRRRHSYSRCTGPSTVMHFACTGTPRNPIEQDSVLQLTLGTVDGEGDSISSGAFAYALLGRYPDMQHIATVAVRSMINEGNSTRQIALGPSTLLSIFNPRENGFTGNLYIRDFSSPNPMAYTGVRVNVNIPDRCVIIHGNDASVRERCITALQATAPDGSWTFRGP